MKNFKKNQVIIFVAALMLITAGYLNFSNEQNMSKNLLPTSSLADSEQIASIGDATLVNANQTVENNTNQTDISKNDSNNIQENVNENNSNLQTNNMQPTINNSNVENTKQYSQTNTQTVKDEYFTQSRLDRDNMYSQMLENYQKILEANNLTSEEKELAQTEIKRINNEKNAIMIAENLIKTKDFEDTVIFINNGNVSVIVKTDKLEENQIAQIQNIITRELNVKVTKINVSNRK